MRTKKPLLIALLLFTWSFVSYFLLLRQTAISSSSLSSPSSRAAGIQNELNGDRDQQHDLLIKLNQLEENIRYESRLHDQLLHKLLSIIRLKEEQSADVPHIVEIVHEDVRNVIDGKKLETINQKIGRAHVTRLGAKNIAVDDNVIGAANGGSIQYAQDGGAAIDKTVYNVVEDQAQVDTQLKQMTKEMLPKFDFKGPVIPILVFACNRISVRNCLDNLIQYRPNANQFPIIVSQVSHKHAFIIYVGRVQCTIPAPNYYFFSMHIRHYQWHLTINMQLNRHKNHSDNEKIENRIPHENQYTYEYRHLAHVTISMRRKTVNSLN